jgi:hypothetical protein
MGPFRTIRFPRGWWWGEFRDVIPDRSSSLISSGGKFPSERAIAINIVTRVSGESGERERKKVDDDTISRLE